MKTNKLIPALLLTLNAGAVAQPAPLNPATTATPATAGPESERTQQVAPVIISGQRSLSAGARLSGTVQVVDEATIRTSSATSVTELLAEKAAGFFSEWTPAQTSINLRGGTSDGQGRDFRSQVLVLLDGRRAGTANLSKLSLNDVARIEIIRGPASVTFGSSAMGGVINLITRSGANTSDTQLAVSGGSWSALDGRAHISGEANGVDYYAGGGAGKRGDYRSGSGSPGPMFNTGYQRWNALGAIGKTFGDGSRIDFSVRRDGVYDAGFRGSSWDIDNYDRRYNQSADLAYAKPLGPFELQLRAYTVNDVDEFFWGSEVGGVNLDHNTRKLDITGINTGLRWRAASGTEISTGIDVEQSRLRSNRNRLTLAGVASITAPMDNNHNDRVAGLYGEATQRLFDDRLDLRAGARFTDGRTTSLPTPGRTDIVEKTVKFDQWTYSLGASYRVSPLLRVRANHSTGFRAPTATELAADFQLVLGGQVIGNPNLSSETSRQTEIGMTLAADPIRIDMAVFESRIEDRINTKILGPVPGGNRSQYFNSTGALILRGVDLQASTQLLAPASNYAWNVFTNGTYHFKMLDEGAAVTANTNKPGSIYQYQASLGSKFSQGKAWDVSFIGVLRGPMWYDTEERLLIPLAEPNNRFIHRKAPFWVFNLRGGMQITKQIRAFASIDNLLNKNEHPIFIALNKTPFISDPAASNGGRGNSIPGRTFRVGLSAEF